MKMLFIPNWNGHLYISEEDDTSIKLLYEKVKSSNKELIKVVKNNIEETNKNIESTLKNTKDDFILAIAGDHSNTYTLFKKFKQKNKDAKLVIFDAHPDVEVDTGIVSHEDYLRKLIEDKIINPKDIYILGLRTFSRLEYDYLIKNQINFFTIDDILRNKDKINNTLKSIKDKIYLSLDIDVLDPDDAPGTYYQEYCGLHINELIEYINTIKNKITSADIVEFYKKKDKDNITLNNILKIIAHLSE